MVVVHVCPLEDDPCNGVLVVVPALVKAQRQYIDAAVWNVGQPFHIDGLEQVFTANAPEELPSPYNRPDLVVFHELYITCYLKIAKALQPIGHAAAKGKKIHHGDVVDVLSQVHQPAALSIAGKPISQRVFDACPHGQVL